MPRKREFPITIKAGSTAIRIYFDPHQIKVSGDGDQTKLKHYPSFLVSYYRGGKRVRHRFSTLEEAQTKAQTIQSAILDEKLSVLQLTGKDLLIYSEANRIAKELGVPLDVLTKEYAAARKKLGPVGVLQAADFYDRYGQTVKEMKTVPVVVDELITSLKADNLSPYHVGDMERRLKVFYTHFPGYILEVTTKQIAEWMRNLVGRDKKNRPVVLVSKTKNHYRNAVVQLFNFARDHGYLPRGLPTEAEAVKALNTVPSANEIFTVEEIQKLLNTAPDHLLAPMAIKAFSGVRTEEMLRMKWEHFNWQTKHIRLPAEVTKTSLQRLIPISENLEEWVAPFKHHTGRICSRWLRPQALFQAFDRHGKRQDINVGANKFRNSYITYRVAVTHDVQRVALESGNSPQMIQREYLELVTEAEGKRWFQVVPKKKDSPSLRTNTPILKRRVE